MPIDSTPIDGRAFRAWLERRYGDPVHMTKAADDLGVGKATLYKLMDESGDLRLAVYLRMLYRAGEPLGTWLRDGVLILDQTG